MKAKMTGGPYDGIEIDHNDINLYTLFQPVGTRKFIFMPPRDAWDAVRRGEREDEKGKGPIYEIVRTESGVHCIHDPTGDVFSSALTDEREGRGPQPVQRPETGAYYHCVRGTWAMNEAGRFLVKDEKDREWACRQMDPNATDHTQVFAGLAEAMQTHEASGNSERLSITTLHCESPDELPRELADIID